MAILVRELREWLATIGDDDVVAIDDGGLTLRMNDDASVYIEIGGTSGPDYDDNIGPTDAECDAAARAWAADRLRDPKG